MPTANVETFFSWFQSHKGYVDRFSVDIFDFPVSEGGTGVIALKDIPVSWFSLSHSVISLLLIVSRKARKGTLYSRSLVLSSWAQELVYFLLNLALMHGKMQS